MATFPWAAATSRTTGISAQSLAFTDGYTGSVIDNSVNLDDTMDVEVIINCSTAPTANTVMYIYILYSLDGTNFEDGSSSIRPAGVPLFAVPARNVTGAQRIIFRGCPISPLKFKLHAFSALNQTSVTTVNAKTYRRGYAA